jgi:hypothetical protein
MKPNCFRYWLFAFYLALSILKVGAQGGFTPFDPCMSPADPNKRVLYKQLIYKNHRKIVGPEDYFYETKTERVYVVLPQDKGVKLVFDYVYEKLGTNVPYENTLPDGPVYSDGMYLSGVLQYFCGTYGNGAFGAWEGELLNAYLNGDPIQLYGCDIQESHSSTDFSATFTFDGEDYSDVIKESMMLDGAFIPAKEVNDGKDAGENCDCSKDSKGMPIWYVTEPYINLWIRDTPAFYQTSLGEEIAFEVMYKQRDTRPTDTNVTLVPVTGWQHNWFSYLSIQTPDVLTTVGADPSPSIVGTNSRGARVWSNWDNRQ